MSACGKLRLVCGVDPTRPLLKDASDQLAGVMPRRRASWPARGGMQERGTWRKTQETYVEGARETRLARENGKGTSDREGIREITGTFSLLHG
jgi:hypothetical protein